MRWSKQLIPTLREAPQEAEIPSHRLMLRAGFIRKLSSGLYSFLPLGFRALRKVEQIVREEMDRAGALEILMPALHPQEIWDNTGRFEVLKNVMFKIRDRQDRALVLGPTHEEIVTSVVAGTVNSYKQLPVNLYQIQTKFRDEIRPRFGLMRAKEFIMKDAYSFDVGWDEADVSYKAMYEAYQRIFDRCGLRTKIVEADTGAMGGSSSHEFMVLADSGEDGIVECKKCSYAANLERAESRFAGQVEFDGAENPIEEVPTPNLRTVEEVSEFFKSHAARLIKTLIYKVDDKAVAVLVPGDRDVNEVKLARVLGVDQLDLAEDLVIEEVTGAPVGFAGPVGLSIKIIADERLRGYQGAITGANKADTHIKYVDIERDAGIKEYADITLARGGDVCPRCQGLLEEKRGIEVGHVFKLGTKYSEKLGALFLDADGKQHPAVMGCYGIGVTRTLQAVVEQSFDENGVIWPISIAPYSVEVMAINAKHDESVKVAEQLIEDLEKQGVDVLYDDRDERPGVKFKDADLVGLPLRVCVGERSLAKGQVELKIRQSGEVRMLPVSEASDSVMACIREMQGG